MHNFTANMPAALLTIAAYLCCSYVTISFGEHQLHKHLMHKKRLPAWIYRAVPFLIGIFENHAIRHHGKWYREFDFEPHRSGRYENIKILMKHTAGILIIVSPIVVLFFAVSPVAGAILVATIVAHNRLWNLLHGQMHMPEPLFFSNWEVFRWLGRNHYMHHQFTAKNYNVVFPLADYVLGTLGKPSIGNLREMMRLGYLQPKSARAMARLAAMQAAVSKRRALQVFPRAIAAEALSR